MLISQNLNSSLKWYYQPRMTFVSSALYKWKYEQWNAFIMDYFASFHVWNAFLCSGNSHVCYIWLGHVCSIFLASDRLSSWESTSHEHWRPLLWSNRILCWRSAWTWSCEFSFSPMLKDALNMVVVGWLRPKSGAL